MGDQPFNVGDAVALVHQMGWGSRTRLTKGTVEKVTKTQVAALGGRRFNIRTGVEIGAPSSRYHASPKLARLTPELLAEEAESQQIEAAERKCYAWADLLQRARSDDAVRLAEMLPDPPAVDPAP